MATRFRASTVSSFLSNKIVSDIKDITHKDREINVFKKRDISLPSNMAQMLVELENEVYKEFKFEDIFKLINLYKECVEFYSGEDKNVARFYLSKIQEICTLKPVSKQFQSNFKTLNDVVYKEEKPNDFFKLSDNRQFRRIKKRMSVKFKAATFKINEVEIAVRALRKQELELYRALRKAKLFVREDLRVQTETLNKRKFAKMLRKNRKTGVTRTQPKRGVSL